MATSTPSTQTVYPSIDAYEQALAAARGEKQGRRLDDPLSKYIDMVGWWTTGAVIGYEKPLPVTVQVADREAARRLAAKGGRPLAESDPRLLEMIRVHFAGRDPKDVPPAFAPFVGKAK